MNLTVVNPIQLAKNIAMLDHFTNGRVFAGSARQHAALDRHVRAAHRCDCHGIGQVGSRSAQPRRLLRELEDRQGALDAGHGPHRWRLLEGSQACHMGFQPTNQWAPGTVGPDKTLKEIGIVPRPYAGRSLVYYPFSQSMETVRFWGRQVARWWPSSRREGGLHLIAEEQYMKAAEPVRRQAKLRMPSPSAGIWCWDARWLRARTLRPAPGALQHGLQRASLSCADGAARKGSRHEVQDEVARLVKKFKANEIFFLWHHVGYFPQEVELAMLSEFAEAVIKPMSTVAA